MIVEWLRNAGAVTVLTGAGISTESGIPDFRGPQGVWTKDPDAAAMATIDVYLSDPEVRRSTALATGPSGVGRIQKSATISFGQALKPEVFAAAERAARDCELFLAVGSSLGVQPAAGLCLEAVENGARLVVINAQETPYDRLADAVVREPIGQVLPTLVSEAC